MLNQYYYSKHDGHYIVYEAKNIDKGVQMSLYKDEELLATDTGLLGDFVLSNADISLKITNKSFKSIHKLTYKGSEVPLEKVKLKDLRETLSRARIFNAVNPTQAQLEENRFKSRTLLIPLLLMGLGFYLQYLLKDSSGSTKFFPILPEAIAGWMLFDITVERFPSIGQLRKGRLGFMAMVVVGLGILGEYLFSFL